ncbi:MAG: AI-2E family transporter, partial [Leptolyngbyaceae cyanobacterium SM2_3_12]|nr:AI-2E family transporter [Leptolyngbyaceae cyanobacterium SM2_3_12]
MKFSQWLSLIILVACLYIIWQIRNVLLLGLTAVIFAIVLNQATRFLQRWISSRKIAVVTVLLTTVVVLVIFGFLIIPPFYGQLQELFSLIPQVINQLQTSINQLQQASPAQPSLSSEFLNGIADQLRSFNLNMEMLLGRFVTFFSNTLSITVNLLLVVVLIIMLVANPSPYRRLFVKAFPASLRQRVWQVMDECESDITGWFTGILFNMTVIAGMSMIGLWILGVPLAFANGLVAGLLAFIPNIGPVLSVSPRLLPYYDS